MLGKWLGDLFVKSGKGIFQGITESIDKFVHTKEERAEFELALKEAEMKFQKLKMDAENMYIQDRQSARKMYMKDSFLQKIFGIVFLAGYLFLSCAMVMIVLGLFGVKVPIINAFQASIISMVFTAMSTKVNTITDFLFGGSQTKDDSEQKMADEFVKQKTADEYTEQIKKQRM